MQPVFPVGKTGCFLFMLYQARLFSCPHCCAHEFGISCLYTELLGLLYLGGYEMRVYFHWYVHWDLNKVMTALARHYGLEYINDDATSIERIVTRAYQDYHGVRDLNVDTHLSCIKGQVQEMLKSQDSVAPDCVRCMAYHNMLARMKGFDLQDLVGQPPYPDNWEKPRPKFEGEIAETHYAY